MTLSQAIRLPLRLIPPQTVVRVLSGVNRGYRWRVGSSVHGCWLGHYEIAKQRMLRNTVKPGMLAFDVGAQAGFYTLAFARLGARTVSFEPHPQNAEALRFHVAKNCIGATIHEAAVSDRAGRARFRCGPNLLQGSIAVSGEMEVPTVALDSMGAPDIVKIDVEGNELAVLMGARELIARRKTTWLVALDDPSNRDACLALLAGYRVHEFAPGEVIATA